MNKSELCRYQNHALFLWEGKAGVKVLKLVETMSPVPCSSIRGWAGLIMVMGSCNLTDRDFADKDCDKVSASPYYPRLVWPRPPLLSPGSMCRDDSGVGFIWYRCYNQSSQLVTLFGNYRDDILLILFYLVYVCVFNSPFLSLCTCIVSASPPSVYGFFPKIQR